MKYTFPDHPAQMEPLISPVDDIMLDRCYEIAIASAKLVASVHPVTAHEIGSLVSGMNCYYSNLIEGHDTKPVDIDRAMAGDYSDKPEKRILQLEARAHIEVERKYLGLVQPDNDRYFDMNTMMDIHRDFYNRLPEELHWATSKSGKPSKVAPGELRSQDVEVGAHLPPAFAALPSFIERMQEAYDLEWKSNRHPFQKIPIVAAAHHRLLWVHPFLDGNGRVARLVSVLAMKAAGIDGIGLWSPARGLSKKVGDYRRLLQAADSQRRGTLDGRGNLSASALREFSMFYIETCLDQVKFMSDMFDMDKLRPRVEHFFGIAEANKLYRKEGARIVLEAIRCGEIARGDAERLTGLGERLSRDILGSLIRAGLLKSDTPKGSVRAAFPAFVTGYYFPNLFPAGSPEEIFSDLKK